MSKKKVFKATCNDIYPPIEFEAHFSDDGDCYQLEHVMVIISSVSEKMVHENTCYRFVDGRKGAENR